MYKILIVDDDLDLLSMTKIILERNNFLVKAISNWEDIDSTINKFHPDLILLDTFLNGADGRQICRNIKSDDKIKDTLIFLFSALPKINDNLPDTKADGFIEKPFQSASLVKKINNILAVHTNANLV